MTSIPPPAAGRPAVEGWFHDTPQGPALIGQRCEACSATVFPPVATGCPNPECACEALEPVDLPRTGRLWSYTHAGYAPPPPYVAADPHVPFGIAAVELDGLGMIVLGQVEGGWGEIDLRVGAPMVLAIGPLHTDDAGPVLIWKWRRAGEGQP